jgi:SPP1 family phage portal protein
MLLPNFLSSANLMDDMNYRISRLNNTGKPQEEFLYSNMWEFKNSDERKLMLTAQKYYENKNDICDRKRYYIDRMGIKRETENVANSKLSHPYLRKITNQKVNYLLSKEFTISCENKQFLKAINKRFNKSFRRMLKNIGKDAIIKGIAWVQPYYDSKGELKFKRIPAEEIKPFWADAEHTILDGVLRFYAIKEYLPGGTVRDVTKAEYHTLEGVWYYIVGDKGLEPDPDKGLEPQGHFSVVQDVTNLDGTQVLDENGQPVTQEVSALWDRIPFIAFRYSPDEFSLLQWIKPLVDDYDLTSSDNSNNLQDIPNSIKVVKNYDGSDKNEFTHNLATYRTAFVNGDGDMHSVDTPFNTEATEAHLTRLRKDIYESGSAVDTQEAELGNASGVALKFRYADLDMDADDMANEFTDSIEQLIWFMKVDMLNAGEGDFMDVEYSITFHTAMIMNEAEIITEATNSQGVISDETILTNHPWVTDVAEEQKRIKKEKDEALKSAQESLKNQNNNFGSTSQETVDNPQEPENNQD